MASEYEVELPKKSPWQYDGFLGKSALISPPLESKRKTFQPLGVRGQLKTNVDELSFTHAPSMQTEYETTDANDAMMIQLESGSVITSD